MPGYVKVAVESPLPQLDKLFDYLIPDGLHIEPGMRLVVPFGRAKKPTNAFAIEISETTDSTPEKISQVLNVVSSASVLTPEIYSLARAVADRQASTLHDVLRLAVPARSVKVESAWLNRSTGEPTIPEFSFPGETEISDKRVALFPINHFVGDQPGWALQFSKLAISNLRDRKSTIIVVPDYRDQLVVLNLLNSIGVGEHVARFENSSTPSKRYASFLKSLGEPAIVLGSRSAIFAPAKALASILLLNDGDSSLIEPTSPYLATREIALIRQQMQDCQLVIAGHARSCEVQRLVEMDYLKELNLATKPAIAVSETEARVDSLAFQTIRKTVDAGGSVLIQVGSAGTTSSLFCQKCSERVLCKFCNGSVGVDSQGRLKCRLCSAFNLDQKCLNCNSDSFRQGRAGVTRTAEEFGKTFPGVNILEASGSKPVYTLKPARRIVVATVGAEPVTIGGYDAVVLLDAQTLLARDTLRATENAVRHWADAIALLKQGGRAVLVGVATKLGQQFALWNQSQIAAHELASRRELGFPPHLRMASLTGSLELTEQTVKDLAASYESGQLEVLGPLPTGSEVRFVIRYEYSIGAQLAVDLRARVFAASAGSTKTNQKSGRISRALKLKMDDAEVV